MSHLTSPLALRLGVVSFWNSVVSSFIKIKQYIFMSEDILFFGIFDWFFYDILKQFGYLFSHIKILRGRGHLLYFLIFFYNSILEKKWINFFKQFFSLSFLNLDSKTFFFRLFSNFSFFIDLLNLPKFKRKKKILKLYKKTMISKFKFFFSFRTKGLLFSIQSLLFYYLSFYKNSLNHHVSLLKNIMQGKLKNFKIKILSFLITKKLNVYYHMIFLFYQVVGGFLNANIINNYITTKLFQRFKLFRVIDPLLRTLNHLEFLLGFKIACAGRFTRKQIATYYWEKSGKVSLNNVTQFIDYKFSTVILKNSICGIKIWLSFPLKLFRLKELFKNVITLTSTYE